MDIPYESLDELRVWARARMQRHPDFVIGDNYLRRWWIVPRECPAIADRRHLLRSLCAGQ